MAEHGTPGEIAERYHDNKALHDLAFSCSLCGLCSQVCPMDLKPAGMFLDLRREAVRLGGGQYAAHRSLLTFEKLGGSNLFSLLLLPPGCTSVFFPGCALPGARPVQTLRFFQLLKKHDPSMGIMLDCCNKPSHDLGRQPFFEERFALRLKRLGGSVRTIITACPNCHLALKLVNHGRTILSAYEVLTSERSLLNQGCFSRKTWSIHDPCSSRSAPDLHQAIRTVAAHLGLEIMEMAHNRESALCCGEGGAAGCLNGQYARTWSEKRRDESRGLPLITYCACCTAQLRPYAEVHHLVDLLFPESDKYPRNPHRTDALATWYNRLKLKTKLQLLFGRGSTALRHQDQEQG